MKSAIIVFFSLAAIAASVLTGSVFYDPYHPYNPYEAATYAGFHRALWSIGSVGLIYVASYGHAKFIWKILTWSPWVPLSKLQYGKKTIITINALLNLGNLLFLPLVVSYKQNWPLSIKNNSAIHNNYRN